MASEETAIERANRKLRNIENPDVPYNERFLQVAEVAALLQISESTAYRFMSKLNKGLKAKGKEMFSGRLSVRYLKERVYIQYIPTSTPQHMVCPHKQNPTHKSFLQLT